MPGDIALYSAVHDILTHYEVDIEAAVLTKRNSIRMPAKVQYAWPHPSLPILYVSTSNGGPKLKSDQNHVTAYSVAADGSLAQHGESKPFARRAVHMCLDPSGRYALNGHNAPTSGITVWIWLLTSCSESAAAEASAQADVSWEALIDEALTVVLVAEGAVVCGSLAATAAASPIADLAAIKC